MLSQPTPSHAVINTVFGILYTLLSDLGPNPVESPEELRIIGAGLPRTGTSSLNAALRVLGYNAYHQTEIMKDRGLHASRWADVGAGRASPEDMFQFLSHYGYNATLDYPVSEFYDVALEMYPDAKVIMTVRDDPKRWEKSWNILTSSTGLMWDHSPTLTYPNPIRIFVPQKWHPMRELRCSYGVRSFGLQPCEMLNAYRSKPDGWLEDIYERHVASVRGKVPPERLLEFNVKDGWEPLCKFLGLPVPDIPFPNIADSSLFIQLIPKGLAIYCVCVGAMLYSFVLDCLAFVATDHDSAVPSKHEEAGENYDQQRQSEIVMNVLFDGGVECKFQYLDSMSYFYTVLPKINYALLQTI